eukprot:TRINITY_DN5735_c0_g1_i1.p2 TRINITY_DN5735_c0_g1~~TRINITY_DN5735_c0_g1_i1.p2  ORF type:complete len:100 (+),score=14.78 TRINITY_DN5735_c0_g1_i1:204-503(+)
MLFGILTITLGVIGVLGTWWMRRKLLYYFMCGAAVLGILAIIDFLIDLFTGAALIKLIISAAMVLFYVLTVFSALMLYRDLASYENIRDPTEPREGTFV